MASSSPLIHQFPACFSSGENQHKPAWVCQEALREVAEVVKMWKVGKKKLLCCDMDVQHSISGGFRVDSDSTETEQKDADDDDARGEGEVNTDLIRR